MSMFIGVTLEQGPIPESIDGGPGIAKSLCASIEKLDSIARDIGLRPLGEFVVDYDSQMEAIMADEKLVDFEDIEKAMARIGDDGPWFEIDEGLATVRGLIQHFERASDPGGNLIVLRSLETELEYGKQQESRFHLSFTE